VCDSTFHYKLASFTGLSAHSIGGNLNLRLNVWCLTVDTSLRLTPLVLIAQTIHAAFKVPVFATSRDWMKSLSKPMDRNVKEQYDKIKFIVLDEFSLAGKGLLAYIDALMKKVDPAREHIPFAGRSVILAGYNNHFLSMTLRWEQFR